MLLEACVENLAEAIKAEELGADRVELCENLHVGGTTPSAGTIYVACQVLKIPVMVLVRPRGGNFVYSKFEIDVMKKDIDLCRKYKASGVVIGALTSERKIDIPLMKYLVSYARPMQITFHKAIDETSGILAEFEKLAELDIDRVLTSGGYATATEGADMINNMVKIAGHDFKVMAAGQISNVNLEEAKKKLKTDEFHGRRIVGRLF